MSGLTSINSPQLLPSSKPGPDSGCPSPDEIGAAPFDEHQVNSANYSQG